MNENEQKVDIDYDEELPLIDGHCVDEDEAVDDTGKTVEQILAEEEVTQEQIDAQYPSDYNPLKKRPKDMEMEELFAKAKESSARLKNHVGVNPDGVKMPSVEQINEKIINDVKDGLRFTKDGDTVSFNEFLEMMEKCKDNANKKQVSDTIRQQILSEIKQTLNDIYEKSELEKLDAKTARNIWLEKIKTHSRLNSVLLHIKKAAVAGRSNIVIGYLVEYDRLKLKELGFKVSRSSGQAPLECNVSWE